MSEELAEIVEKVAEKTGLVICLKDANEVLKYTVRKCEVSGTGPDYIPVLFENELRDFLTRKIINARGAIADVFDMRPLPVPPTMPERA